GATQRGTRADPEQLADASLANGRGLMIEVGDRNVSEDPDREPERDHLVGPLVVDVNLRLGRIAGDDHGFADTAEMLADCVEVDRAATVRTNEEDRLVAMTLVRAGHDERQPGDRRGPFRDRCRADEVQERALEQSIEALATGVDDAGLAQNREEGRRLLNRPLRSVDD